MSASDLNELLAYERIEPSPRIYLRAILDALTVLCNAWTSKGRWKMSDFLPQIHRAEPETQSAAEGMSIMRGIAAKMETQLARERP